MDRKPTKAALRSSGKSLRKQAFWRVAPTQRSDRAPADNGATNCQLDLFEEVDITAEPCASGN